LGKIRKELEIMERRTRKGKKNFRNNSGKRKRNQVKRIRN